jgi:hypothetical protein
VAAERGREVATGLCILIIGESLEEQDYVLPVTVVAVNVRVEQGKVPPSRCVRGQPSTV